MTLPWVPRHLQNQEKIIDNLSYENELLKHRLSNVYFNEKAQFEKLQKLKKTIERKIELDKQLEFKKIEEIERKRKNEDLIIQEILQRQKEEISLLKTAIQEEQEARLAQKHNHYISMIK